MMLYAGSSKPITRKAWVQESPDVSVRDLVEDELPVKAHFGQPEVQNIGSTSSCGCDFPNLCLSSNGDWPEYSCEDSEEAEAENLNRRRLVELLRQHGEVVIELYALWYGSFGESPKHTETLPVARILDSDFRFREEGFYRVIL
ncbi:MAG TPA: hypothetical protein VKB38_21350 [Terracidiphilus sp.]|nr:hypothetical protein [Terracidiphilus sp.]